MLFVHVFEMMTQYCILQRNTQTSVFLTNSKQCLIHQDTPSWEACSISRAS